jgi:hypothetical protein
VKQDEHVFTPPLSPQRVANNASFGFDNAVTTHPMQPYYHISAVVDTHQP